jgi:glycosyltransferase involved in cell wall biosynthesis
VKRMLFIVPNRGSSFMEQDISILSKHFIVHCSAYTHSVLPKILTSISSGSYDIVYLWFVYPYALPVAAVCNVAKIPCILIPAGVDLANDPEIGYGHMRYRMARLCTKASLRLSNLVLPVSNFMKQRVLQIAAPRAMRVVYNGVDTRKFRPKGGKEDIVLSVAGISKRTFLYKRLDVIVQAARGLPDYRFVLVGEHVDRTIQRLKAMSPGNVELPGRASDDDLLKLYQKARVYVQISHSEAFGVALAEAMACECVPVVVNRGALPEVVGETGYYAPYADPAGTSQTIMRAMAQGDGSLARQRIERNFTSAKRESELVGALEAF